MTTSRRAWHVGEWGALGWAETVLKTTGCAVAVVALLDSLGRPAEGPEGWRLAQVLLLAVLSVALVAAVADRLAEREIVGMVFIPVAVAGHVAMTLALLRDADAGGALVAFAVLLLAGDLTKLGFLATSGFRVRDLPPAVVAGLTAAFALAYLALLLMQAAA